MRAFVFVALMLLGLLGCGAATGDRLRHLQQPSQPPQPPQPPSPVYLWPMPASVERGSTDRAVSPRFSISTPSPSPDFTLAMNRFMEITFPHRATGPVPSDALLSCYVNIVDVKAPLNNMTDESYDLNARANFTDVNINANTTFGAMHALQTLSQLIYFNFTTSTYHMPQSPWHIIDAPRFPHRGMLVDTSRHYQTLPILRRVIDSLAFAKYNVFHWHLSDSQSFPWHSETRPLLSMAAWTEAERYSNADIADIVEYARQRGVRVMIEFDVPGHASSWCVGYPDVCPSATCNSPLDLSNNATFDLMRDMFNEITGGRPGAGLVPDALFHLGGDEVDLSCWTQVPHVAQWLKDRNMTATDGYRYIVERAHEIVYAAGRIPVNWDEVWYNFGTTIDPSTIIHVWRDESYVFNATREGFRVLVSPDGPWYLDGLDTTWQDMYLLEPAKGITDPEQMKLVLGGESTMWGESVDASVILPTIWPRAAAVAERLWSPMNVTSTAMAEPRYAWFRCLLDQRGIEAGPHLNTGARQAPPGPGGCLEQ